MRRLETAAGSDRGRVRARNEDAFHLGQSVFAVADGMGGHLAGDVASATALLPVKALDGKVFPDAASAQAALLDAILAANAAVVRKAANEPNLLGMGTTLTATIVEGRRLHVGHVGDSRAYLVRDGAVTQLTRDHTLVAHLIEEGQITEEEAARHPQRSVITRAIGVDVELDVDTLTIDLQDGDAVVLCSDGLTGPVSDEEILRVLESAAAADDAVQALIDRANAAGGPDNITVVLLRYYAEGEGPAVQAGEARPTVIRPDAQDRQPAQDWATALGRLGTMGRPTDGRGPVEEESGPGRGPRVATVLTAVVLLTLLAVLGGRWLLSRSYYVGLQDEQVAIFHGVPAELGPIELYWVAEPTELRLRDLPAWRATSLRAGIPAADRSDARNIVATLRTDEREPADDGVTPAATASPATPTAPTS